MVLILVSISTFYALCPCDMCPYVILAGHYQGHG